MSQSPTIWGPKSLKIWELSNQSPFIRGQLGQSPIIWCLKSQSPYVWDIPSQQPSVLGQISQTFHIKIQLFTEKCVRVKVQLSEGKKYKVQQFVMFQVKKQYFGAKIVNVHKSGAYSV